jgi:hypothetical protein
MSDDVLAAREGALLTGAGEKCFAAGAICATAAVPDELARRLG